MKIQSKILSLRRAAKRRGAVCHDITPTQYQTIDRDNCKICHVKFTKEFMRRKTHDHIIPIIHGGEHAIHNLQIICMTCNKIKADSLDVDYTELAQKSQEIHEDYTLYKKEYRREYNRINREKINARQRIAQRRYYSRHPEKVKARNKAWKQKNWGGSRKK